MVAYVAALIALLGLLLNVLSSNPKVVEFGRILFFCGTFVVTWQLGQKSVRLF